MSSKDTVWFDAFVTRVLENSIAVETDDGEEHIIPMSQIRDGSSSDYDHPETDVTLGVPRWLAEDREIEYREDHR